MAKHVLYNASVTLNAIDLSAYVDSVELKLGMNSVPAAGMGEAQDYNLPGTKTGEDITLNMFQDFAASKVYATLYTLWNTRATFDAVIKADAGSTAATNPAFTQTCFIKAFPIVSGKRGDAHMTQIVLSPSAALSVATS